MTTKMTLDSIRSCIQSDLDAVENMINAELASDVQLITELCRHLVQSGGKRIRPILLLLTSHVLGYPGSHHISLAAALEFVHTATLLHDDVVDGSHLRRGQKTANEIWGDAASVLVGDYMYSRAFQLMVKAGDLQILETIAKTTNTIAHGEVRQLMHRQDPNVTEQQYLEIIQGKTAELFTVAAKVGASLAKANATQTACLVQFGTALGMVFQLVDDVLDYHANTETIGKNIGDDLAEGKMTLPLIYALANGNEKQKKCILSVVESVNKNSSINYLGEILQILVETEATQYTYSVAEKYALTAKNAISALNIHNVYAQACHDLVDFALRRVY